MNFVFVRRTKYVVRQYISKNIYRILETWTAESWSLRIDFEFGSCPSSVQKLAQQVVHHL